MKFGAIDAGGKKFICGITDEKGNHGSRETAFCAKQVKTGAW